jgi:hypothetical protein
MFMRLKLQQVRSEIAKLRVENARLARENDQLRVRNADSRFGCATRKRLGGAGFWVVKDQ